MRLISAACLTIMQPAIIAIAAVVIIANVANAGSRESDSNHQACAVLATIELVPAVVAWAQ